MGSWNKWRGPAPRGEAAVYAAKARRNSIDSAHDVVAWVLSNPALFHFSSDLAAITSSSGGLSEMRVAGELLVTTDVGRDRRPLYIA